MVPSPVGGRVVPDLRRGRVGLVLVLHHVLADGIDGLAILARLVDGADPGPARTFPQPCPTRRRLAADALRSRLRGSPGSAPGGARSRRSSARRGGVHAPRAVACSILQRDRATATFRRRPRRPGRAAGGGAPARRHRQRRAPHRRRRRPAHAAGAARRADRDIPDRGDGRRSPGGVGGHPRQPGRPAARRGARHRYAHRATGADVRGRPGGRASTAGRSPAAVPPTLLRLLAATGLYRLYMSHQHRLHTLVSNVHGPDRPLTLDDAPIAAIIPISRRRGRQPHRHRHRPVLRRHPHRHHQRRSRTGCPTCPSSPPRCRPSWTRWPRPEATDIRAPGS